MPVRSNYNFKEATAAVLSGAARGMEEAAKKEKENTESKYDSGSDALGRPWAELSPATIQQKGHSRKLYEKGDMRNAFYVQRTGPLSVVFGNSDPKINWHEYGAENLPRRAVLTPAKIHLEQEVLKGELAREIGKSLAALRIAGALR